MVKFRDHELGKLMRAVGKRGEKWKENRIQKNAVESDKERRTGRPGFDPELVFDALGLPLRRKMIQRLQKGGAMSLSKLGEPYKITLPATYKHVALLEKARIVTTHKRGRVRMCIYEPSAFKQLAAYLTVH